MKSRLLVIIFCMRKLLSNMDSHAFCAAADFAFLLLFVHVTL